MRISLTGGSGFIGSNFIFKQLKETDNFIINFYELTYIGDISKFKRIKNNKDYKFVKGDICDRE